jgi:hypothetical protein
MLYFIKLHIKNAGIMILITLTKLLQLFIPFYISNI